MGLRFTMDEQAKFNVRAGSKFARIHKRPARYGDMVLIDVPWRNGTRRMAYAVKGERGWYPIPNPAQAWRVLHREARKERARTKSPHLWG